MAGRQEFENIDINANNGGRVHAGNNITQGFIQNFYTNCSSSSEDKHTDADERACLQSLAFFDMDSRLKSVKEEAAGTCLWLLEKREYKTWVESSRGILAVTGPPGSGKSTLLKFAFRKAAEQKSPEPIIASFFFDDCRAGAQKEPIDLLRSITHQIAVADAGFRAEVTSSYRTKCQVQGEYGQKWNWHETDLRNFLESLLPRISINRPVQIYVDALYECGDVAARELGEEPNEVIKRIDELPHELSELYDCILDRVPGTYREESLRMLQWICFALRPLLVTELYIAMHTSPDASDSVLRECQTSAGSAAATARATKRIRFLSGGLADVVTLWCYTRSLEEPAPTVQFIHGSVRDYVANKKLRELSDVSNVISDAQSWLSASCARYIAYVYQEMGGMWQPRKLYLSIYEPIMHEENVKFYGKYRFLRYSMTYWIGHAQQAEKQISCRSTLLGIFESPPIDVAKVWSKVFGYWDGAIHGKTKAGTFLYVASVWGLTCVMKGILLSAEGDRSCDDAFTAALGGAIYWRRFVAFEFLLMNRHSFCSGEIDFEKVFAQAVEANSKEMVDLVLLEWAAVRSQPFDVDDALYKAIEFRRSIAMAKLLLEARPAVEYREVTLSQLLFKACQRSEGMARHTTAADIKNESELVMLLIQMGADINYENEHGLTLLLYTLTYGERPGKALLDLMKSLISSGAKVDCRGRIGHQTPLHCAVRFRDIEAVKVLLDYDAPLNPKNKCGDTPLAVAKKMGKNSIAALLQERGAH